MWSGVEWNGMGMEWNRTSHVIAQIVEVTGISERLGFYCEYVHIDSVYISYYSLYTEKFKSLWSLV